MALRFTLFNSNLGQLVIDKADPIDINAITQTVKRSKEINEGVLFEIILDVEFIKDARQYIKTAFEQTGGIDAEVQVTVYEYEPNLRKWEIYATGQIDFRQYELSEDRVKVNINQTGFTNRVLNLIERDIDIETELTESGNFLSAQQSFTIPFHSKIIQQSFISAVEEESDTFFLGGVKGKLIAANNEEYIQIAWNNVGVDELNERFTIPTSSNPELPANIIKAVLAGDVSIQITIDLFFYSLVDNGLKFYVRKNNEANIEITRSFLENNSVLLGYSYARYTGTINISLAIDDELRIFGLRNDNAPNYPAIFIPTDGVIFDPFSVGSTVTLQNKINITQETTFPETSAKVIFLHDAIKRCVEHITNESNSFYSELLGRTELGYTSDGEGWNVTVTNGNLIRGLDKQIFFTLKQLIDISNSLYNVGFGFETLATGKQRLRLEKIDHFYNKNFKIASLGEVYNVRKRIDNSRYYNQIEYGYSGKIDIGQVNGIDEFNTVRRSAIPVKNTKNQLKVASQVKAGGYLIEYQRRLSQSTEDGKFDDDNFLVVVVRDGSGGFRTKRNEGYSSITNVISPETSYNLDISPARMLRNWFKVIASSLIYSVVGKAIKFSSGEVNYEMTSTRTGEGFTSIENGDVDISGIEPIWDNMIYSLDNVKMPRNVFKAIKANPFGYIEFEDQFGEVMEGFISSEGIEHDSTKGTANLQLIKVFRNGL